MVINCVPDTGLVAERSVLAQGGTIMNVASLPLASRLELEGQQGRGLVVLHSGLTPGITTLLFKALLARFPEADELEYAWASSAAQSSGKAGVALVAERLGDRRRRKVKSIDFPAPVGSRRCIEWGSGEEGWFGGYPESYACRAWFFLGPAPVMHGIRVLNSLGAVGLLPRRLLALGRSRIPESPSTEPKRDVVAVNRAGNRLGAYAMQGQGDYAMTVGATLALLEALMPRRSELSGAYGAENLFEFEEVRPGLDRRGVRFVASGGGSGFSGAA